MMDWHDWLAIALIYGVIALLTVIPWVIGIGWMAHHWIGV